MNLCCLVHRPKQQKQQQKQQKRPCCGPAVAQPGARLLRPEHTQQPAALPRGPACPFQPPSARSMPSAAAPRRPREPPAARQSPERPAASQLLSASPPCAAWPARCVAHPPAAGRTTALGSECKWSRLFWWPRPCSALRFSSEGICAAMCCHVLPCAAMCCHVGCYVCALL